MSEDTKVKGLCHWCGEAEFGFGGHNVEVDHWGDVRIVHVLTCDKCGRRYSVDTWRSMQRIMKSRLEDERLQTE